MARINRTKSQAFYYRLLINLHIIRNKLSIIYQKQSMKVYSEVLPVRKFLIHLNFHKKKPLETVDTSILI